MECPDNVPFYQTLFKFNIKKPLNGNHLKIQFILLVFHGQLDINVDHVQIYSCN